MKYFYSATTIISGLIVFLIILGCSSGSDVHPTTPPSPVSGGKVHLTDRVLWGFYEFYIDPASGEVNITPCRQISMHLNALKYLETSTTTYVSLESPPQFGVGKVTVDIGIKHPYQQKIYTGFDVRGVIITRGGVDFGDGVILPGPDDLRLLNPDGYTRFWNPSEFYGAGYQDGILGTPHSIGQFDATVNGFKYFADGLGVDEPLEDYDCALRGAFSAGTKNVRRYELGKGNSGLLFNYAVDASWAMPDKIPPAVPDDFDPNKANSKEAWLVVPEFENMLTPEGGICEVEVDVYDWQGISTIDAVRLKAPDIFDGTIELGNPVDNGEYYTFSGSFSNDLGCSGPNNPLLICVVDTGVAVNPNLVAYQIEQISIGGNVVITLDEDEIYKTPGTDYNFAHRSFELSVVPPPFDYSNPNGPWDFTTFDSALDVHRLIFAPDDPVVSEFVGDFPESVECFVRDYGNAGFVYRAEEHDETAGAMNLYGMYSWEDFNGSILYTPVAAFPYPQDIYTDFTVSTKVIYIPFILELLFDYHVMAVGQGWVKAPLNGGTWHNCLYLRTTLDISVGGAAGYEWQGTLLSNEWIADDGTVVGQILSGNDVDSYFNFDPDTYEITGTASFLALQEISTF